MLTAGSLFSGIGGLDLGLERAGIKIVWQCEIDEFCRRVLAKHWPDVPCYKDIKEIDHDTPKVDILFGGFPCQPVSAAGKRKAQADSRWLWPEFARVIGLLRPQYVVVENVPGLRTAGMGFVLADLSAFGYDAEWDSVSAAVVGAPHIRERVFIVAHTTQTGQSTRGLRGRDEKVGEVQHHEPSNGGASVAHTDRQGSLAPLSRGLAREEGAASSGCGSVANANSEGLALGQQPADGRGTIREEGASPPSRGWWSAQCRLGEHIDGPVGGLDCGGWECGVPRTTTGQKDRVPRLKALGNAVVPQVAEHIGRLLIEAHYLDYTEGRDCGEA